MKRVSVELLRRKSNYSDKKMYFCADFFDMMVEVKNKRTVYAYIALVLAQIFWGISFVWTKELLNHNFNVIFVVVVRLLISFALLWSISRLTGQVERIARKDYGRFFLLAFFEPFLYFIGENYGLMFVDASYASIFIAIIPVVVPFGLYIFYKQKISWTVLLGVAISIVGISILSLGNSAGGTFRIEGVLLLLLAVVSAVGYNLMLFGLLSYKPITIIIHQNVIAAVLYLPMFAFVDRGELVSMHWNTHTIVALVMLAVFCSSIAFMGYSYAAKNINISRANVFTNAIPVVTIIFAVAIGQESLTLHKAVGMAVVIGGVLVSQFVSSSDKSTSKNRQ